MTLPFDLGSYSWILWVVSGILVLGIVWGVIQFFMKLTMKIFMLGCLGIIGISLACGAVMWFSGGR